jgi:hypothetical protein
MTEQVKDTPAEEVKPQEATTEAKPEETKVEDVKVGDMVDKEAPEKEKAKMVPEAVFLEEKRERKELSKQLKELTKLMEEGATRKEVSADVKDIADEFGLTEQAVAKLIEKVGEKTKEEYDKAIESKLRPLQEKERSEKAEKTFNEHFDKLMEAMPEFKNVANRDVIKTLSLDPKNSNKTFAKILEESYGHLVVGKKTLEKTQARGGVSDSPIDIEKARKDPKYYQELMDNPELKKKYNEGLIDRLRL